MKSVKDMNKAEMVEELKEMGVAIPSGAKAKALRSMLTKARKADEKVSKGNGKGKEAQPSEETEATAESEEKELTKEEIKALTARSCGESFGHDCDPQSIDCQNCQVDEKEVYDYCHTQTFKGKAKKKAKSPKKRTPSGPTIRTAKTIEELEEFLARSEKPTNELDRLLLQGGRLVDINKKWQEYRESVGYGAMKNISGVKNHIKFRTNRGWLFEWGTEKDGETTYETVRLVEIEK